MKELSIKEKAKRYDEAYKFAEYMHKYSSDLAEIKCMEDIFPELKESEDERIVKELLTFFRESIHGGHILTNKEYDSWIAWLEKQGSEPNWCHHKVDLSNCSEEYRKAYYDGWNNCNMQHSQCKSDGNDVVKCLINGMKFYYEDNKEATWGTEKFSMKVKDILSWLEKQGENNMGISEATKQKLEENLNKALEKETAESYNEFLDEQGEQKSDIEMKTPEESLGVDSDTYNKIVDECIYGEQKPAEWNEKDELSCFESALFTAFSDAWQEYLNGEEVNVKQWAKEHSKEILEAAKEELKEQKPVAWSDEDKTQLNRAIYMMEQLDMTQSWDDVYNWLKSLKERVIPQPNQEWSKEDKEILSDIITSMTNLKDSATSDALRDIYNSKIDWLKSLRPQTTWKPSDEQMKALKEAVDEHFDIDGGALWHLYEDLKKLSEE